MYDLGSIVELSREDEGRITKRIMVESGKQKSN
jgi:hypothetical protein